MMRVLPMPIANYRIDGKDLFTERQMQAYTIQCQEAAKAVSLREWQGLTDEEVAVIASTPCAVVGSYVHTFARAIEAKLKEKNG